MGKIFNVDQVCEPERLYYCYAKGCGFKSEDIVKAERHSRTTGHQMIVVHLKGEPNRLSDHI